jgi:hypothetical protein
MTDDATPARRESDDADIARLDLDLPQLLLDD